MRYKIVIAVLILLISMAGDSLSFSISNPTGQDQTINLFGGNLAKSVVETIPGVVSTLELQTSGTTNGSSAAYNPVNGYTYVNTVSGGLCIVVVFDSNKNIIARINCGASGSSGGIVYNAIANAIYVCSNNKVSRIVDISVASSSTTFGAASIAVNTDNGYLCISGPSGPSRITHIYDQHLGAIGVSAFGALGNLLVNQVIYNYRNGNFYVTNGDHIYVFNGTTGALIQTINMTSGNTISDMAVNPDNGYVYATAQDNGSIQSKIKIFDGTVELPEIVLSIGDKPYGIIYNTFNGYMYYAANGINKVGIVSGSLVIGSIAGFNSPTMLAYNSFDQKVYVGTYLINTSVPVYTISSSSNKIADQYLLPDGTTYSILINPAVKEIYFVGKSTAINVIVEILVPGYSQLVDIAPAGDISAASVAVDFAKKPAKVTGIKIVSDAFSQITQSLSYWDTDSYGYAQNGFIQPSRFFTAKDAQPIVNISQEHLKGLHLNGTSFLNFKVKANSNLMMTLDYKPFPRINLENFDVKLKS